MKVTGKAVQVKAGAGALWQLTERFASWRSGRKLGDRIPPELWAAAVEMVAVHGAYRVARALTLDYDMLKRRVALGRGKATSAELAPRFVELFAAAAPMPASSASLPACVVELANAGGARMRGELNDQGLEGLRALCSVFLGAP